MIHIVSIGDWKDLRDQACVGRFLKERAYFEELNEMFPLPWSLQQSYLSHFCRGLTHQRASESHQNGKSM